MLKFIVRRIFWTIPVLLVVIFLTFMMMRQIEETRSGRRSGRARVDPAEPRAQVPLDQPWWVHGYYVKGVFTFDLGPSLDPRP